MNITLLGTSCMVPTKERNVSSWFLEYKGEGFLFDCGEGTQRQMNIAGISRSRVRKIFISHWHADHVSGIMGLIQTIGNKEQEINVEIYGPKETKKRMKHILDATIFDLAVNLTIHEFGELEKPTIIVDKPDYKIEAISLNHSIPCFGYSFIEKERRRIDTKKLKSFGLKEGPLLAKFVNGESQKIDGTLIRADEVTFVVPQKKVTYVADTGKCKNAQILAKDANLLICESSYADTEVLNAKKFFHLTSSQAATIAKNANVKELILTHISQRYSNTKQLGADAKKVFPKTSVGYDLMKVSL